MKTVTIISVWEAETEVEMTDEEYAEFVATGDPPDRVLDEMPLHGDDAGLVNWRIKK